MHLTKGGRFRQAADREKEIGQIYLQETKDIQKACASFERAGEWYAQEDATAYDALFHCSDFADRMTAPPMHASKIQQTSMPILSSTPKQSLVMNKWQTTR